MTKHSRRDGGAVTKVEIALEAIQSCLLLTLFPENATDGTESHAYLGHAAAFGG